MISRTISHYRIVEMLCACLSLSLTQGRLFESCSYEQGGKLADLCIDILLFVGREDGREQPQNPSGVVRCNGDKRLSLSGYCIYLRDLQRDGFRIERHIDHIRVWLGTDHLFGLADAFYLFKLAAAYRVEANDSGRIAGAHIICTAKREE